MANREIFLSGGGEIPLPYAIPLSDPRLAELAHPRNQTEDDIIARLDAANQVNVIFNSHRLNDRQKAVLAIKWGVQHPVLANLQIPVNDKIGTFKKLYADPNLRKNISNHSLGVALGVSRERVKQITKQASDNARSILSPPDPNRPRPYF